MVFSESAKVRAHFLKNSDFERNEPYPLTLDIRVSKEELELLGCCLANGPASSVHPLHTCI